MIDIHSWDGENVYLLQDLLERTRDNLDVSDKDFFRTVRETGQKWRGDYDLLACTGPALPREELIAVDPAGRALSVINHFQRDLVRFAVYDMHGRS